MMRAKTLLSLLLVLGLLAAGCQNDPNPIESDNLSRLNPVALGQFVLPADAVLESATFFVYVHEANNFPVNIYRVTESWDELTVTWNSFGGAYDGTVINSFVADAIDWRSADITGLVQGWLDGEYENFGILLDQELRSIPRASYFAREFGYKQPYVELCYTSANGQTCEQTISIADTYIWQASPDGNNGYKDLLYTGLADAQDLEKQSLLLFEIEQEVIIGGCTHTKGYWDNWDGLAQRPDIVTRHLPIWMGYKDCDESFLVPDVYVASDVLGMNWDTPKNGIVRMMAQLLCAKLNISTGADKSEIIDVVNAADNFLCDHNYMEWYNLNPTEQKTILKWMEALNKWNAGKFGPGPCKDVYY